MAGKINEVKRLAVIEIAEMSAFRYTTQDEQQGCERVKPLVKRLR